MLAEELGREAYIAVLNQFFDHAASAFADAGGEILSFMGDAFLAIFPSADSPEARKAACEQAFAAALAAVERMAEANMARKAEGHAEIGYGLGLHIGNVMFGNVGLEDRLAFSIFGAAVNEVARLQALTKTYEVPIIASEEFRSRCDGEWQELGQQLLRGMSHPITIYTPSRVDPKAQPAAIMRRLREVGRSEAENVVLLHRDRPKELAR
jgi:adenylate cyclase